MLRSFVCLLVSVGPGVTPVYAQPTAPVEVQGCEETAASDMIRVMVCPGGISEEAMAVLGKEACGETRPCGTWFFPVADIAPEVAPARHDGFTQEEITGALGVYVAGDDIVVKIEPVQN